MTTTAQARIGAPLVDAWDSIDWNFCEKLTYRLQVRIAQATRERRWGKVKALQRLLTHSFAAKALAVKRVTSNKGKKTAGVDNIKWKTPNQKWSAIQSLTRKGVQSLPLRRIYIPKKNGKKRPLGIPTMAIRAQQALHLMALEPVAESTADINSYGFRPKRSAADAIEQCFNALTRKSSATWVLEGDIRACFDQISHDWLLKHIPMDRFILRQWLTAGYLEDGALFPTEAGTPQGGIASPVLANLALDGLEHAAKQAALPDRKVHVIRYADDFVITGTSREVLEKQVKPAVIQFLKERGLQLSEEKTRITQIDDGFDFLGFNVRKHKGKLLIKPSKAAVLSITQKTRTILKVNQASNTGKVIQELNSKLRGWTYYYRHVVSKRVFSLVDCKVYKQVWSWARRRHPNKSALWCKEKYFRRVGVRDWMFFDKGNVAKNISEIELFRASDVSIKRHIKIKGDANPYDPLWTEYFALRRRKRQRSAFPDGAFPTESYFSLSVESPG